MGWLSRLFGHKPKKEEKHKVFTRVAFVYGDTVLWLLGSNMHRTSNGDDLSPQGGHICFDELVGPRETVQRLIDKFGHVINAHRNTMYLGWEDGHVYETIKHVVLNQFSGTVEASGMCIVDRPHFVYCGPVDKAPRQLRLMPV